MANDQLKQDLKNILKIKSKVTKERPVKGLLKKEAFIRFIENYKYANDRALMLKMEHAIDFVNFEEPFVQSIEALLELNFNKNQLQIIHWWLYEKWNTGDESVLQLNNVETGDELPSDTSEELWDLIQSLK
tara:strand:- start:13441 stop:13833 length:393 start_codon:yes stop_codon:yes gene_type:complete